MVGMSTMQSRTVISPVVTCVAIHLLRAPTFDARLDDPAWREVPPVAAFRQYKPRDDAEPTFRTEFRVGYDERNLYVLVRAYDPHPDSIVGIVTRRDGMSESDEIGIYIDGNADHRTGYEFYVNAAGVQRDVALSGDVREDVSWDAVWSAVTRVDSLGWVAEFRIPFSQIRFPAADRHAFGFLVDRQIPRLAEHVSWPAYHTSRSGIVSQFGVLDGLVGITGAPSAEVSPFARVQSTGTGSLSAGADFRVRPVSNVTLDGTVMPDFGQVEADPSVVNLSTIETFYPEHRPFFLDGAGTFRVGFNCLAFLCGNDGLFYSRRIGQGGAPIYAAAKLAGRTNGGLTIGALAASTGQAPGPDASSLAPPTTYGMARAVLDSRDGQSGASLVATLVGRRTGSAMVGGGTFRHKFGDGQYEVWGSASASRVGGSEQAIAALQRNSVHDLQRVDDPRIDTARTSLAGDQEEIAVGKYGGSLVFETAYARQSRGYDPNDMGYLQRADEQTFQGWLGYSDRTPRGIYQRWWANVNHWDTWNAAGMRLETAMNTNAHMLLTSNWQLNGGVTVGHLAGPMCDHCARGGPALRIEPQVASFIDVVGDDRARFAPELYIPYMVSDDGRTRSIMIEPSVAVRLMAQLSFSVGVVAGRNRDNTQWLGNFTDSGVTRYSFARLDQQTRSLTLRASYAATPRLSLQTYVAPFASDGDYSDVRALSATPRADSYDDRFVPFPPPTATPSSFAVRELRATTVLRWEYAPGSALFAVWAHDPTAGGDVLTLKMSYWIGR